MDVFIDASDLTRECREKVFILGGEAPSFIADEADPTVDMGRRCKRGSQKGVNVWMQDRQLQGGRLPAAVMAAYRSSFSNDCLQHPVYRIAGVGPACRLRSNE